MIEIALTAVVAALVELVLHYFPWRMVFRADMPRTTAYILGVLGFAGPLTVLWSHWGMQEAIYAMWTVIVVAGAAVRFAYWLDELLAQIARGHEAQELLDETRTPRE